MHDAIGKPKKPFPQTRVAILQRQMGRAGINWYCMERGMKRHQENHSRYEISKKLIKWTVKLVFVDILKEVVEFCYENEVLENIIGAYIDKDKVQAENKITFEAYLERGDKEVKVLFSNEFDNGENLRYTEVNSSKTLEECLRQKAVLEFPEFHVALDGDVAKTMVVEEFVKEKEVSPRLAPLDNWL